MLLINTLMAKTTIELFVCTALPISGKAQITAPIIAIKCVMALDKKQGIPLLILVWSTAIVGIIIKIFFINCPHWVSSIIYIGMGWTCVLVFKPLLANLPASAFAWLLAGGIIYTVGGIIYGLKLPIFDKLPKDFGSHEIFHLFVMGGSICHFIFMYAYLM